jgi:hypothetical protein
LLIADPGVKLKLKSSGMVSKLNAAEVLNFLVIAVTSGVVTVAVCLCMLGAVFTEYLGIR